MNNIQKGDLGESLATRYLQSKGAYIIENKFKIKSGEIDIIAKLNDEILFVEVKSRSNIKYGYPSESVNYRKKKKDNKCSKILYIKK